jgi:hypothetical protein
VAREGGVGLGSDVSTSQLTLGRSPGRAAAPPNLEYGAVRRFPMRSEAAPGAQARAPARRDGPHQRRKNATSVVMSFAIQERPGRMDEKRRTAPYSKTHNGGRHDDLDLEYGATTVLVAGRTTFEQRPTFPAHERRSLPATNNLPLLLFLCSFLRTLWARGARRTSFQTCPTFGHPVCP